jgi:hypothetical protein
MPGMNDTPPWKSAVRICCLLLCSFIIGGCSSRQYINLKIHTEPEGSHLVYKIAKEKAEKESPWVYLGVTPFTGVSLIEEDDLETSDKISFKVMRHGYLDQVKEWNGKQFIEEYEEGGVIFWTPRLIKSNQ